GGALPPFGPGWLSPGAAPSLPPGLARAGLPVDLLGGAPWQAVVGACGAGLARVVLGAGRTLALPCDLPLPPGAPLPRLPVLRGPLPPAADLVALGLDGRVKDQAQVGVCGYFAMTTLLENGLRRAGVRDEISPLHVIAADAWDDIFQRPSTRYLAPEVALPYDPAKACELGPEPDGGDCSHTYGVAFNSWRSNPRLVEAVGRADARGAYAGVLVDRLSGDPDEIAGEIARGRSVYVALAIDGDAWSGRSVEGGAIPEHGRGASAHAVVLTAYQVTPGGRFFLVHNSWGADWGRGGYAWLSEANLRRNFKHAFLADAYLRGMPVPAKHNESTRPPMATPSVPVLPGASALPIGAGRPSLPPAAGLPSVPSLPGVPGAPAACSTPLVAGLCLPRPPRPLL
ncbi:MAG TPA: C1 family peptidase, partial [Polyangiaceae bacterium]|nr:C1 family peptidase [Polyangiaceae bacterium]